ncbi:hypothetical protein [Novipirellula artificiosorum]|nr:hypothetical protein [Novipirellula artificiosorum]
MNNPPRLPRDDLKELDSEFLENPGYGGSAKLRSVEKKICDFL